MQLHMLHLKQLHMLHLKENKILTAESTQEMIKGCDCAPLRCIVYISVVYLNSAKQLCIFFSEQSCGLLWLALTSTGYLRVTKNLCNLLRLLIQLGFKGFLVAWIKVEEDSPEWKNSGL